MPSPPIHDRLRQALSTTRQPYLVDREGLVCGSELGRQVTVDLEADAQSRSRGLVRGGALADGAGLRRRATGRASETIAAAHLLVAKEKKPATLRVWPAEPR